MAKTPDVKSAGTDELGNEVDALIAKNQEQDARLDKIEDRLDALEEGGGTDPIPPEPPSGGFVWDGITTVWPKASTTGPRGGVAISNWTGSLTISTKQVIKGKRFAGKVRTTVHDVEFEDCIIEGFSDGYGLYAADNQDRLLRVKVRHCKISGAGAGTAQRAACILATCTEVVGCDLSGSEDGIKSGGGPALIKGNYFHDSKYSSGAHGDGIQLSGANNDTTIEENWIEWIGTNACMFTKPDFGPISNTIVRHNYLSTGPAGQNASYTVYFDNNNNLGLTGSQLVENVIVKSKYGPYTESRCSVTKNGNIDETGRALNL